MNTLTKYFAERLLASFRFLRRPTTVTEAAEPASAGTLDWFTPPPGVPRTWEEALAPSDDADVNDAPAIH